MPTPMASGRAAAHDAIGAIYTYARASGQAQSG